MKLASTRRGEAGFTLLEMLVSIVVLGFLLVGLGQAVHFGLAVFGRQTAMLARAGRQDAADRALRRLIEQARPGQTIPGTRHRLVLLTTLPASGESQIIDAAIFVDRRHRLVMAWAPHRFGISLTPPAPVRTTVLLHHIDSLTVAYWWPRQVFGPPVWQAGGPVGGLPRLIRLTIRTASGKARPWPAMVAGPSLALR